MAVKIDALSEEEIRSIGDAFGDYAYGDAEWGMGYLFRNRKAISDFISAYARLAVEEKMMYSTSEAHEAFIAFRNSDHKVTSPGQKKLIKTALRSIHKRHFLEVAVGCINAGKNYKTILKKMMIPYIYVDMVAVTGDHQGRGFMRPLMEIAFEEGRRHGLPVVLETDAELKKAKYEHLGMKCVTTLHLIKGVAMYSLVYEPDSMPPEWKSEAVLGK